MNNKTASVLLLSSTLTVMAGSVISPALPGIRAAFHDQPGVELLSRLVMTAPALGVLFFGTWIGHMVDRLGRRRVLWVGLVVYGVGGVSGFFLNNLLAILAGRLVLGAGVAGVMTAATTLIADLTTKKDRNHFLGLQAAFMGTGGLVTLALGGRLADLGWRWPFLVYGASCLLVPAVFAFLERDKPVTTDITTTEKISAKAGYLYLAFFLGMALFFLMPVQLPFLLHQKFSASGTSIGLSLGLMNITAAAASLTFNRMHARFKGAGVLAVTFGFMGPGLAIIGWSSEWVMTVVGIIVLGWGVGLLTPNLNTWGTRLVPPVQRGRVVGNLNIACFLGQFVSPLVVAPFLSQGLTLDDVFIMSAGVSVIIALFVVLLLPRLLDEGRF